MYDLVTLGKNARRAARTLRTAAAAERNAALFAASRALRAGKNEILEANRTDVEIARRAGCRLDVLERLSLTPTRIEALCTRIDSVIAADDPIGSFSGGRILPNMLGTSTVRVPIGVVAFVSDSAPSAAADAFAMCIKTGNACVLAGGKNSYGTDRALVRILRQAIGEAGLTMDALQFVEDVSDETTSRLLNLTEYIDLVIPYGDVDFIRGVLGHTGIPAIDTSGGCCCMYIDRAADLSLAVRVLENARTAAPQSPVCTDTVFIHSAVAQEILPKIKSALDLHAVKIHGDERVCRMLSGIVPLTESERGLDYRDMQINICIVDTLDDALEQIEKYSDRVADVIITQDCMAAMRFAALADAAAVTVNASPRFTEGAGEEPGITLGFSVGKLHVRGPVGLGALTTTRTIVFGNGQVR